MVQKEKAEKADKQALPTPGYGKSPLLRNPDGSINLDQFKKKRTLGGNSSCDACIRLGRQHRCGHKESNKPLDMQKYSTDEDPPEEFVTLSVVKSYTLEGEQVVTKHPMPSDSISVNFRHTTSQELMWAKENLTKKALKPISVVETQTYIQYVIEYDHFCTVTKLIKDYPEPDDNKREFVRVFNLLKGIEGDPPRLMVESLEKSYLEKEDFQVFYSDLCKGRIDLAVLNMTKFVKFIEHLASKSYIEVEDDVRYREFQTRKVFDRWYPPYVPYKVKSGIPVIDHTLYRSIRDMTLN